MKSKKRIMWRKIHPCYSINNYGKVMRDEPAKGAVVGRILKPYSNNRVSLFNDRSRLQITIDDLLKNAFKSKR